jgi:hypothetical protein
MNDVRNWKDDMIAMSARLLEERTGEGLESWKKRMDAEEFADEQQLRDWLSTQGVTGYAQSLLVWERFGYPDFLQASADELIDGQYADRPHLRPILDAILAAASGLGPFTIQARKTFVALVTTRRTFARIQPTTKKRVDLALRLDGVEPQGRLQPSKVHDNMHVQISLETPEDVAAEVLEWLQRAYDQNR